MALLDSGANAGALTSTDAPLCTAAVANCGGNLGPETTLDVESKTDTAVCVWRPNVPLRGAMSGGWKHRRQSPPRDSGVPTAAQAIGGCLVPGQARDPAAGADTRATCLRRRKPVDYARAVSTRRTSCRCLPIRRDTSPGRTPRRTPRSRVRNRAGARTAKPAAPAPPYDAPFDFPSSLKDFKDHRDSGWKETLIITLDWCARAGRRDACACAWRRRRNRWRRRGRQPPAVEGPRLLIMVPIIIGATVSERRTRSAAAGTHARRRRRGRRRAVADRLCAGESTRTSGITPARRRCRGRGGWARSRS